MGNRTMRLFAGFLTFLCLGQISAIAQSEIGVAKSASRVGRQITLDFYLENFGTENLTMVSLSDDLDSVFGAGNYTLLSGPTFEDNPGTITLNGSYTGATPDDALISSGSLNVGDTAQIRITVEITNVVDLGMGLGVYSNQVTASAMSSGGTQMDLSDEGTDPDPNGNGDPSDAGEDDPTVIDFLADPVIGIAKYAAVSGTQITFDFYLEGFGNRTLTNVSVIEDLDAVFGAGNYSVASAPSFIDDPGTISLDPGFDGSGNNDLILSGSLAVSDTAQIRIVVDVTTVTDQGFGTGIYQNQAMVAAQAGGTTATDISANGIEPDLNGNGNPRDLEDNQPTVAAVNEDLFFGVAKDSSVSGSSVTIDLYLENLGNSVLSNLSLIDNLNDAFGAGNFFVSTAPTLIDNPGTIVLNAGYDGSMNIELLSSGLSTLTAGDTAQIRMVITILNLTDQGSGLGIFSNQARASANGPNGGLSLDLSDDGNDPDPNGNGNPFEAGENDPTPITVNPIASLGIAKDFRLMFFGGVPSIELIFTVTNYGNQTVNNISISDDLNAVYGAGNYLHQLDPTFVSGSPTFNFNTAFNGSTTTAMLNGGSFLAPGDSVVFRTSALVVSVTDQGFGAGVFQNQVTVLGTDPSASPVSDQSHTGRNPDPDGNGNPSENDPTVIDVNTVSGIGIAKDANVVGGNVTIDFYLENLGGNNLTEIGFIEDLDAVFGAGNYTISTPPFFVDDPGTLTLNPSFDGSLERDFFNVLTSSLNAGDTGQVQMVITIDNVADVGLGLGNYQNQVTVQATTPSGSFVNDLSDFGADPDPNGNGNANENGENDPTSFSVSISSPIGVAKQAGVVGNVVTIDLFLENHGPGTLSNVLLTDDLDAAFGAGNYTITTAPSFIVDPGTLTLNGGFNGGSDSEILSPASTLAGGATAQIQFVVSVDTESDQGNGFGIYSNQASARGTQADGLVLVDQSDDGTDPDPNGNNNPGEAGEDDATNIIISVNPVIGVAKKAYVSGTVVTLDFYIENLGDSTLTNVLLRDPLNPVFGSGNFSVTTQPTLVNGPSTLTTSFNFFGFGPFDVLVGGGFLRPGDVVQIRTQINITNVADVGNGLGVYLNSATISAGAPDGSLVMDTSDDGLNPDPNGNGNPDEAGENDASRIEIGDENRLGIAKTASVVGSQVTLDFYLENFGASALSNLSVIDDLDAVFGPGNYTILTAPNFIDDPGTIVLNGGFDGSSTTELLSAGSTLAALDTAQIQMTVTVTSVVDLGNGLGNYINQVSFAGSAPNGSTGFDLSDNGTDPDPNGNGFANDANEDDATRFVVGSTVLGAAKNATVVGNRVTLDYYIENLGTTGQTNVTLTDDLDAVFGAGNYVIASGPTRISAPRNLEVNPSFNGSTDTNLILPAMIGLGVTEQIQIVVDVTDLVDNGSGLGVYTNQVTVNSDTSSDLSDGGTDPDPNGNGIPDEAGEDDPTVFSIAVNPVIGISKTASVSGRTVTINLFLEAFGNVDLSNLTITEALDSVFGNGNYSITMAPSIIIDPGTINLEAGFDGSGVTDLLGAGSTLAMGATAQIRFAVMVTTVTDQGFGSGIYQNQVTAAGTAPDGTSTTDLSDDGSDPDPNGNGIPNEAGENDATVFQLEGDIGGRVYNDLNGNGADDSDPGLGGIFVFLDTNTNGMFDSGEPSMLTGGTGAFNFSNLAAGAYSLVVDTTSLPMGFVLTTANQPLNVTLGAGENFNTADVGYQQQNATIGDFVFNDADGDGLDAGGKAGLAGITVFLDLNTNGTLDGGEPSATTDAAGNYDITNLATGTYVVDVDSSTVPAGFVLTTANLPLIVNLAAGEDFNTADFGYQQQDATIGDLAFRDLNGNGIFDGGEPGQANITVYLDLNNNGMFDAGEPSSTSNGGGDYDITNLPLGTFTVRVLPGSIPAGFVLTTGNDPSTVNLAAGEDFNDADFGFQQQNASIGDFVWNDLDGDGVQDGGEPGLDGVTVYLDLNANGSLDAGEPSAVTAGGGAYDITALATGTYNVTVDTTTLPSGFVLTGGTNPVTVNLAAGEDFNDADFGYQQQNATIGDFVWNDLDGDGVQDGGEPGLAGVTVYLDLNSNGTLDGGEPSVSSNASGAYDFTGLPTGTYVVRIDSGSEPAGFVLTSANSFFTVNLAAGEDFNDADFGYQQQDATIGDFVWNDLNGDGVQDGGEPGLSGVMIFLDLNSNGVLDGGEPSDTTDAAGAYDFANLATGTYSVMVDVGTVTAGFVLTGGTNPVTVNLAAGEDFNDADFGYQQQDATIGDFVWNDLNGDGVQDGGEPGFDGITVYLDLNSNGALDAGEPSAVTAGGGAYDITDLATGTYSVNIDPTTVPTGYVLITANLPLTVNLAAGEDFNDADFGYQRQDGTIGDFVWNDLNGDGVQDAGEPGLDGVTVDLIDDTNGNGVIDGGEPVRATVTTAGGGAYEFTNLAVGDYIVNVTDTGNVLTDFVLTGGVNPLGVSLAKGGNVDSADFGYQRQSSTIGDFVWNDLNGDGVQDAGEPGFDNVTLDLIDDLNGNGAIDGGEPVLDTQTTAGGGAFDFTSLPVGDYLVNVTDTNNVLTEYTLTGGSNPRAVSLAKAEDFNDADFGYQRESSSIGDFVWNDLNGDGVQDAGEAGFDNVTLDLIDDLNGNGAIDGGEPVLDTQTTAGGGAYSFTGLAVGDYLVNVTDTNNVLTQYILTGGTNPLAVTIAKDEDLTDADFGYQRASGMIGDFVWNDLNGDGVQDAGEPGFDNVTLDLIEDSNGNGSIDAGEPVVDTQTTAGGGAYDFTNLAVGDYLVTVTDTNGVLAAYRLTGGTDPVAVSLAKDADFDDADFGYQRGDGTIGDLVWHDFDGNGLFDAGEPGLENVTLDLIGDTNGNGVVDAGEPVIDTQTTDANGAYLFEELAVGDYLVLVTDTNAVVDGFTQTAGTNPIVVNLSKGGMVDTADFGYLDERARIGIAKTAETATLQIKYFFRVENYGSVTLLDISIPEDLDAVFGAGVYVVTDGPVVEQSNATTLTGNPGFDGSTDIELVAPNATLEPGEFAVLSITVEITDPPEITTGPISYTNQVTATANGISGNPVSDESTDGEIPDPDGNGNPGDNGIPTLVYLPLPVPTLGEWGMGIFLFGLMAIGVWHMRRQRLARN